MRRSAFARSLTVAVAACCGAAVCVPVAYAHEAVSQPDRVEVPVAGSATGDGVAESYVSIYAPLSPEFPQHPAACDRLGYLRIRAADGPSDPAAADTVYLAMPGVLAGAGSLEPMGRNIVRAAAEQGRDVEVWSLDRRANCLEDHRGQQAAARTGQPSLAFDYLFKHKQIDGHYYTPPSTQDTEFLEGMGLAQTVRDYRTVLGQLPREVQRSKVMCGGHSLGGLITGALARWDFDGTPGYELCSGFFTLDSRLSISAGGKLPDIFAAFQRMLPGRLNWNLSNLVGMAMPYINVPPLTPETLSFSATIAQAAGIAPNETSDIPARLPKDANFELAMRTFGARDYLSLLTGQPDLRTARASNAAVLGAIMDDNSSPISAFRVSIGGTFDPVVRKNFPVPYNSDGSRLVSPKLETGEYFDWVNYDQVPAEGMRNEEGDLVTYPSSEVTDVRQFGLAYGGTVTDGIEWYFPTRLVAETFEGHLGGRQGDLADLHYDNGPTMRPAINLDAGESTVAERADPRGVGPGEIVTLPGYNHLDVGAAAWQRQDGKPEPLSHALTAFAARRVLTG